MSSLEIVLEIVFISSNIQFWSGPLSLSLKFEEDDQWLLNNSTFNILRSSSILGHHHLKECFSLVWTPKLKFTTLGLSDQWLLRYSAFNNLRSSSIGGHFPFQAIFNLGLVLV